MGLMCVVGAENGPDRPGKSVIDAEDVSIRSTRRGPERRGGNRNPDRAYGTIAHSEVDDAGVTAGERVPLRLRVVLQAPRHRHAAGAEPRHVEVAADAVAAQRFTE